MKPVNVKRSTYIDFSKENNDKYPKCKVGDHVRISIYKNIFAKDYVRDWSEEVFVIKKIKNTVPWTYFILILMMKKFFAKKKQKINKKDIKDEKVIKGKGDKLYVKQKGYNSFFSGWIYKKYMICLIMQQNWT